MVSRDPRVPFAPRVLDEPFSDGAMSIRYETWLWIATRI